MAVVRAGVAVARPAGRTTPAMRQAARRRRNVTTLRPATPTPIIAQVDGSGTTVFASVMVPAMSL